jgi:hypothetical protein
MWRVVFDSVQGESHKSLELPCQDCCRVLDLGVTGRSLLVLVCSDGAGSAEFAEEGARIACDRFVQLVEREYPDGDVALDVGRERAFEWCEAIRQSLRSRADELSVPVRQLACTFLAALVSNGNAIFIQVGDGAIVIRRDDEYAPVFWPQSGEFAGTTNFITDEDMGECLEFQWSENRVDELAMFSDGLERLVLTFADRAVHRPFLEPLFLTLRQSTNGEELFVPLRTFLSSPKVNERTDDDKTLILATRIQSHDDHALC